MAALYNCYKEHSGRKKYAYCDKHLTLKVIEKNDSNANNTRKKMVNKIENGNKNYLVKINTSYADAITYRQPDIINGRARYNNKSL